MLKNKFTDLLCDNETAVLIVSPENRFYFTGFSATDGYLLITQEESVLFMDSRYKEAAEKAVSVCRVAMLTGFKDSVGAYIAKKKIKTVFTESDRLTVSELGRLKQLLPECEIISDGSADKQTDALRRVKRKDEIVKIKKAQAIAEAAFRYIQTFIHAGVTERSLQLELDFYMLTHGADALSFETIVVAGKKTSMPHGVPDKTLIREGDFVTMDFGAVVDGYHSDMTRTVCLGEPSDEQRRVYQTVLRAQKAALASLRPGVSCFDADAAARKVIEDAGYSEYFGHGTGHGVGVEIHESPNLSPRSDGKLEIGNVVTVEPGIYIPGKFGVRIEDMAYITRPGFDNLTSAPKELIIL